MRTDTVFCFVTAVEINNWIGNIVQKIRLSVNPKSIAVNYLIIDVADTTPTSSEWRRDGNHKPITISIS